MSTTYEALLQEFVPRPISSQRAYQRTLKNIDGLIRKAKRSRAEDDLLELLSTLVEQYEIRQGHTVPELSPRDRLAGLIEARGLTQTELSRASQVPRTTINEILAGRRGISKANALRLANYFGVPAEEFIADWVRELRKTFTALPLVFASGILVSTPISQTKDMGLHNVTAYLR